MNYETLLIQIHCSFLHTVSQGFITWWCLLIWLLCPHWPHVRCYLPGLPRVTDTSAGSLGRPCMPCLIPPAHHAQVERERGEYRSVCQIPRVWEIITSITSYFEFSWFAQLVHIAAPLTRLTQLVVYRSGLTVYMYPLLSQPAGDSKSDAGSGCPCPVLFVLLTAQPGSGDFPATYLETAFSRQWKYLCPDSGGG